MAGGRIANMTNEIQKLVYPELSYKLNGIMFATHNELERYKSEKQYGDAIEQQLKYFAIQYTRERILPPLFPGESEGRNRIDFLIDDKIILEIKAKRIISRQEYYQVRRYLESCRKKLGILVNFQAKYLRPKRILNSML